MNTAILYHSIHHGNTKKAAGAMKEPLKADLFDIAKRPVGDLDRYDLDRYDLVGFGSGIYFMRHSSRLLRLAKGLKPTAGSPAGSPAGPTAGPTALKKAFIFSTRGLGPPFLYHIPLRRILKARGFVIIGEYSCKGIDTYGLLTVVGGINRYRPNQKDLEKAARFARQLGEQTDQRASQGGITPVSR
ncbi:MAG: flavodoxin family protein [Spirochaetes bacterium]|nr:flavodoxin family protein [Spirochaetota bacterium]